MKKLNKLFDESITPKLVRVLKEENLYPFYVNRNMTSNLPSINGSSFNKEKIYSLNDIVNFEIEYFFHQKKQKLNSPQPLGKYACECRSIRDSCHYILYFVLFDILKDVKKNDLILMKDVINKTLSINIK